MKTRANFRNSASDRKKERERKEDGKRQKEREPSMLCIFVCKGGLRTLPKSSLKIPQYVKWTFELKHVNLHVLSRYFYSA